MDTVAIAGVGLLGGSLAMALRRAGFEGTILGASRTPKALPTEFTRSVTLEEAAPVSDVLVLCAPVLAVISDLERLDAMVRPGTLITDVGSTKRRIMEAARAHIRKAVFLGGHPMAGKQVGGVENAAVDLFDERTWFLVRTVDPDPPAAREFVEWIARIGAVPHYIDEIAHDRSVAFTSHLPQLMSTALAATLAASLGSDDARARSGKGLRDMLRLAQSDFGMWRDILETNADFIGEALMSFSSFVQRFKDFPLHRLRGELDGAEDVFSQATEFTAKFNKG